jgi:hypothetical protein
VYPVKQYVSSATKASDGRDSHSSRYDHADESDRNLQLPDTLPKDIQIDKDVAVEYCVNSHKEDDNSPGDEMQGKELSTRALLDESERGIWMLHAEKIMNR